MLNKSEPTEVRQVVAEALVGIKYPANEAAIPALVEAIENDPEPQVRQRCICTLFPMNDRKQFRECGAEKALTKLLNEPADNLTDAKYDAARKLAQVLQADAPDKTVPVLLHLLHNKKAPVFHGSKVKIEGGRSEVQGSASGDARYMAAEALGWLGSKAAGNPDVVKALREAAGDEDAKLNAQARNVLKQLHLEIQESPAQAVSPATVAESAPSRPQGKKADAFDDKGNLLGRQHPPDRMEAAVKAYEKSCASARASLLKAFTLALGQLARSKGPAEARLQLIEVVKEEKERFESKGLIPWSEPMQLYVERYLVLLGDAQAKLARAYDSRIDAQLRAKNESKAAELREERKTRLDIRILAKWRHFAGGRGGGFISLYSNGRIGNPEGKGTWTYNKGALSYRWPNPQAPRGAWIDTVHVSSDGRTYAGTNNNPRPELRPKFSGVYAKDD